jgi:hypothetical protein
MLGNDDEEEGQREKCRNILSSLFKVRICTVGQCTWMRSDHGSSTMTLIMEG